MNQDLPTNFCFAAGHHQVQITFMQLCCHWIHSQFTIHLTNPYSPCEGDNTVSVEENAATSLRRIAIAFCLKTDFPPQFLIQDTDLRWWILAPNPFIAICNSQKYCKTTCPKVEMKSRILYMYSVVFTC